MPLQRHLLSGVAIALLLSVPALAQQPAGNPHSSVAPQQRPQQQLSKADQDFMKDAAIGGMAEVELGKLAQQNGQAQQVKEFGARMVQDHSKADNELQSLAQQKGVQLPQQLDSEHQQMRDPLAGLHGDAFDRAYMKMMVTDHDKDIKAFRKEAQNGHDRDVKRFADETLNVIEQHDRLAHNVDRQLVGVGSSRTSR